MVFNATFNNISVISWPSVLLVEEIDPSQVTQTLSQYCTPSPDRDSVIGTDCKGGYKSNYHMIMATPIQMQVIS